MYLLLLLSLSHCRKEKEPEPEPLAAFSVQNNNCTAPCEVVFTNASKDATSYRWDFADGQSSSEPSPKHTYTVAGSYIVKLTAKGAGSSNDVTQTVTIKAPPTAAVAQFSIGGGGCTAPCAVTLTNQSQNATSYQWDFGDGQTSTEQNPQHTYTLGKTYTIKLTATGPGGSSMLSKDVSIQVPPPVADFTFTGGDCTAPCEVAFTSKSTNADTYQWDFGDGGKSTEANPRHQYTKGGTFQVVLTATANGKIATKTQSVTTKVYVVTKFWNKTFINASFLSAAIATPDGGFLLAGYSGSPASRDKSENSKGSLDYWVVKISSDGTKQWDKTFGGAGEDFLRSVTVAPDGGFLLAGFSDGGISLGGDKSENSKGTRDYWVVKITGTGVKQWDKTFGGVGKSFLYSAVATPDGGFLLTGNSDSSISGDKSENSKGSQDYWIVKINSTGAKQWDKTFGGASGDALYSAIATPDGGFLLGGESYSSGSGDKSENSKGGVDYWVVKITGTGVKQWDKTFGGASEDVFLKSLVNTTDGGFLLGGSSTSNASGDKSENTLNEDFDYWVVKITGNGTKQWDKTLGGVSRDILTSAVATSDGGFMLAGQSYSNRSGYDKTEEEPGYWVIKIK